MTGRPPAPLAGALLALLLVATTPPAGAANPDPWVMGHRCMQGANNNTVKALLRVAKIPGDSARCEIDARPIRGAQGAYTGPLWSKHDPTWLPDADPDTLDGVPALVGETTRKQVRQIRTTGGEPIPSMRRMIVASAAQDVPQVVEWKHHDMSSWAERVVSLAEDKGAKIWWYGRMNRPTCDGWSTVDTFVAAGAVTGLKISGCGDVTPKSARAHGLDFVVEAVTSLNRKIVRRWERHGVQVIAGTGNKPENLRRARYLGVTGVHVGNAPVAARWYREH